MIGQLSARIDLDLLEAVAEHVALLRELGQEVPEPGQISGLTVVTSPAA